ncbi:MAG: uracil-DNA glycosylase [Rhizobiaceae bacterium]|nr:uracil-DNA glycosylase [Rhizobiaceae bacterium]
MENTQEILEWYVEAGVDVLLEDVPVNRFEELPPAPAKKNQGETLAAKRLNERAPPAPPRIVQTEAAVPDANAIENAKQIAHSANTLEELKLALASFEGCNLKRTAKNLVFADGNPNADIMFIGEAPGRDEDIQGLPFVGRAGQLLDKMLAAINLDRGSTYISNVIPWRPPGNRTPTPQETEICRPFIEKHIELVSPKLVVLLGGSSAKTLLKTSDGIMRLRGKWKEVDVDGSAVKAMPTLHPAYLLRQPAQKRLAWQDLLQVQKALLAN